MKNELTYKMSQFFKSAIRVSFYSLGLSMLVIACAKVNFSNNQPSGCVNVNNQCEYDYIIYATGGMVDILFVDDNSGSMSFEQKNMATHFPNFLNQLDQRMLDYRIGIITTDISNSDNPPRAINDTGNLQDGHLIEFQPGMKFLEPNTPNKNSLLLNTLQRKETIQCDTFLQQSIQNHVDRNSTQFQLDYVANCPSGDERAIYAANNLISSNEGSFIRPEAHLAVVILSDENDRSFGNTDPSKPYALESKDLPQTLIDLVQQKYGGTSKSLRVHSVVVPTGDTACLNVQNNQLPGYINGQYGTVYEQLSDLTSGVKGSVCAADWGAQMGKIGAAIIKQVQTFKLHCAGPDNLSITFTPSTSDNPYTLNGDQVVFSRPLDPSSQVHFKYKCL